MKKSDIDTVTNVILNNEYKLHEEEKAEENTEKEYIIKERTHKEKRNKHKKKKTVKQKIFLILKIIIGLILLGIIGIVLFFKTSLFQKYKEIWVETAMSTMNHKYLATWFLSDEEIKEILDRLKVENNEDSKSEEIIIQVPIEEEKKEITVEKITGKNYVGYVMIIPDASKVKLVDSRKKNRGTQLSEIVENNNAIAGINAGGFTDDGGVGRGHQLCKATIIDKKLLYGYKNVKYSLIGLTADKKLLLGKYIYQEAINMGIESAVEFGPYLIVNGKNQVTNANSGGIHPRTAIGQRKDGTFIFVVIDGRQPGYSLGTNLLELQNIFNRYDAYNAANLDGGSSSTMYYKDKVVNKTSTPMGQRYLPNAFIVEE
ncbi:MAG: phosphodiester glycosidase family protein [Clostridia bacterium]|jgi:exopolysaccharide biosynthesis protein|nr:phosphodiester glycosidase family protein [Clostridia bacterium]